MGKPKARTYQYDGNGNPVYYEESKSFRAMVWDEENRLRGINDNGKLHLYTYDHTGERAVKSSGESSTVVTNGLTSAVITHMDDYTAYVNPYFVVQKGKFTKHYFEGSSRIVSKLGEGTFVHKNTGIMAGGIDYIRQNAQMQEARDNYIRGLKVPPGPPTQHGIYASPEWTGQPYPSLGWQNIRQDQEPPEGWPRPPKFNEPGDVPGPPVQYGDPITPQTVKAGYGFVPNGIREKNLYFYHPDHLGSSSYITDREGRITQHTEYIAFGEVLFEEHSTSKTMPYLFNGKELDTETNLTYFGARYLDMKTSLWLNTDPLSGYNPIQETEHYIDGQHNNGVFNPMNHNTYGYTYNNPIIYIDPTGKQAYFTHGTWSNPKTFKNRNELNSAINETFGNKTFRYDFTWNGHNYSPDRLMAAINLVAFIIKTNKPGEPITLVGHSHGGNVDILAVNMLVELPQFKDREINLLTINTPVRDDYQLSKNALKRVNHINVYDDGDWVQVEGGNTFFTPSPTDKKTGKTYLPGQVKLTGEHGNAGRTFKNARNIRNSNYNGLILGGEMHDSHNQVDEWKDQLPKKGK